MHDAVYFRGDMNEVFENGLKRKLIFSKHHETWKLEQMQTFAVFFWTADSNFGTIEYVLNENDNLT